VAFTLLRACASGRATSALTLVLALCNCAPPSPPAPTSPPENVSVTAAVPDRCAALPAAGAGTSTAYVVFRGERVYLRGFNLAWLDFARDFGHSLDEARLRKALADVRAAGGNSLRWWVHVDGSTTPQWGAVEGVTLVVGPGGTLLADLRRALDIAAEYDVYLIPSLWSFDMLFDNDYRRVPTQNNYRLLSDDQVLQSYLDAVLTPMVEALNDHPRLFAWELFNEPENMTEPWFPTQTAFYGGAVPSLERLQRVQALMAATIHETAQARGQQALVTTGSKSVGKYNSDVSGGLNLYRDDRLIAAAGGNPHATLDFYGPHYYNNEGCNGAWSPFHHPANHWGLDKPIVIGEFYVNAPLDVLGDKVASDQLCLRLENNGYAGGWSWQWNEYRDDLIACAAVASSRKK